MDVDLKGRVAVVTGGTQGIGRAVAQALVDAGANVVVCARTSTMVDSTARELSSSERAAAGIALDLRDPGSGQKLIDFATQRFGRLDIVVNNAVTSVQNTFSGLSDDDWNLHIESKLLAYVRVCRAALPHLEASGAGRIVNVAGMSARQVTDFRMTNGAINAAVTNFTKHLARQCGPKKITANAVHPGLTWTPRLQEGLVRWAELNSSSFDDERAQRLAEIPLGRFIDPTEVAQLIVFLASPLANAVTGQAIAVDGGAGAAISY